MFLNRANRVLGIVDIFLGNTAGTIADPKVIFAAVVKINACGIILLHNHPPGNLKPGQQDLDLTGKIKAGGQTLRIVNMDHLRIC